MKTHLSLRTAHLDESVRFYRTLLNAAPAKHYQDYALFVTEDPPLELALDRGHAEPAESAHYGIVVDSASEVREAARRLHTAGIATDLETDTVCCYARQTKVWAADPDARRWEVYAVLEESDTRNDGDVSCCDGEDGETACCAAGSS